MTATHPSAHALTGFAGHRAAARRFFSTAGTALLCVAVFVALLGPCLCPPPAEGDGHDCCNSGPGFGAATAMEACCVAPATPPAFVEATGQLHLSLAAIPAPAIPADKHASLVVLTRPAGPHPGRGAFSPLRNLRI